MHRVACYLLFDRCKHGYGIWVLDELTVVLIGKQRPKTITRFAKDGVGRGGRGILAQKITERTKLRG
jgi:hypothetical protein